LARLHVVENFFWEIDERTWRKFFENPGVVRRANGLNFMDDAGRDSAEASSVITVTFSSGFTRKQTLIALRAPGVSSGSKGEC